MDNPNSWKNNQVIKAFITLAVFALLLFGARFGVVRGAPVSGFSDTLTDSAPSASSNHTVVFTTPNGVTDDGSTMVVAFSDNDDFNLAGIIEDDIDIDDDGTPMVTSGSCGVGVEVGVSVNTSIDEITFQFCSGEGGAIAGGSEVTIRVGDHAVDSGSGSNQILNPSSVGQQNISISGTGTFNDSGTTSVFIIDNIDMTAIVPTSFTFSVIGVAADLAGANGEPTTTKIATNATTIPWGTLNINTDYTAAHTLQVNTNAPNGFSVVLHQDQNMTNGSSDDIDLFIDGSAVSTPDTWVAPTGTIGAGENSYGHYGVTSEDSTLSGGDEFGTALYAGSIDVGRELFYHDGIADGGAGNTPGIGQTVAGYKIRITTLQEQGDYSNILTYIATPTF